MRRIYVSALLGWLVASPGFAQTAKTAPSATPPSAASESVELAGRMRKILEAWSTLDPAKAAPYFAKDAELPFYDILPLKYTGWTEYAAGATQLFAPFAALKLTATSDLQAHQMGSVGWGTATIHADITKKDGIKEGMDGRWTVIFEKRGSDWLVVHEHTSIPLPSEPAAPAKP